MNQITISTLVISLAQSITASLLIDLRYRVIQMGLFTMYPNADPLLYIITIVLLAGAILGYPLYLVFQKNWVRALIIILLTLLWLGILAVFMPTVFTTFWFILLSL